MCLESGFFMFGMNVTTGGGFWTGIVVKVLDIGGRV